MTPNTVGEEVARGFQALGRGDQKTAVEIAREAMRVAPKHPGALMLAGRLALDAKRYELAQLTFQTIAAMPISSAETWLYLGRTFLAMRRDEAALAAFRQAVARDPTWTLALQTLGEAYVSNNLLEEATQAFRRGIEVDPRNTAAYEMLPRAADISPNSPDTGAMEALLRQGGLGPAQRAQLHYGLSFIYKRAGDGANFIKHMFAANAAQSEQLPAKRRFVDKTYDREEAAFTPDAMRKAQRADLSSPAPIFIVGLPRSGTSLVEQIIGGHADVRMGGEQLYQDALATQMEQFTNVRFPGKFETLSKQQMNALTEAWSANMKLIADGKSYVTDKTPSNYHILGLLPLLFPNAKVISVRRDPMDVAFSILQHPLPAQAAHFHDVAELAHYIARYQKIMTLWEQAFGTHLLTVKYEELVSKPEEQGKRIAAHCGLQWDPVMLDVGSRTGAVHTFSAQQVRRDVNQDAVGAWRAFERDLAPLRAAMKAEGVAGV